MKLKTVLSDFKGFANLNSTRLTTLAMGWKVPCLLPCCTILLLTWVGLWSEKILAERRVILNGRRWLFQRKRRMTVGEATPGSVSIVSRSRQLQELLSRGCEMSQGTPRFRGPPGSHRSTQTILMWTAWMIPRSDPLVSHCDERDCEAAMETTSRGQRVVCGVSERFFLL